VLLSCKESGTDVFDAGYGDGPNRAVFRAGVRILVENSPQWGCRGNYYHPILFPLSTSPRQRDFWVAGTWCALHWIHLGLAPDPISPWWLCAIIHGRDGLPNDLATIRVLDPPSATILEPWFQFTASNILGTDIQNPVRQLLITYLELNDVCYSFCNVICISDDLQPIQLTMFQNWRSPQFHSLVTKALVSSVLIGHHEPWTHPEYQAFQDGFNLHLRGRRLFDVRLFWRIRQLI
jgi:hypothetical protein